LRQRDTRLRPSTVLAWALWATTTAALVAAFAYGFVGHGGPIDAWEISTLVTFILFVIAFSTVGALVASREPRNPVGWIMCWSGLAYAVAGAVVSFAENRIVSAASLPAIGEVMIWIGGWAWIMGAGPAGTLLMLLFPNGKLPSRRFRPVAWLAVAGILLIFAAIAFQPGPIQDYESLSNPVGIRGAGPLLDFAGGLGGVALVIGIVGSLISIVIRYRRAGAEMRQQLKWLTYAAGFVGLCVVASILAEGLISSGDLGTEISNLLVTTSLSALPVAIGIAILKHRLYDIDLIINRTLVYGGLTALLAATYFGIVVLLQGVIPAAGDSDLTIAGSTLAVAALFRPLRGRVQGFIDRRFYRRKFDAQRTLESFSSRLRDDVDLDHLSADLLGVVRDTMQPEHASLWLRGTSSTAVGTP
jgi:hypothetical protein